MNPIPTPDASDDSLLEPADYQQFMLHGRQEVLFILRQLRDGGDPVTLHFNEGRDALPSRILAADDHGVVLDPAGEASINARALKSPRLFAVTRHHRVRIQFMLNGIVNREFEGHPAWLAPLPDAVLRLQRREFFRLALPADEALKCRIPLPGGDGWFTASIVDIGGGGLAVIVPPAELPLEAGMEFANCRIDLPEVGIVAARLQVCTLFDLTLPSGVPVHRVGCRFVDLPGTMLTLVQRYVLKTERERKARSSGLA